MIYLLTAIGLTPAGSSTVHIYTQKIYRTTQLTTLVGRFPGIRNQSDQNKINDELTAKKYRVISSPHAQNLATCPFPEPDKANHHPRI